jgi:hypothetical protein
MSYTSCYAFAGSNSDDADTHMQDSCKELAGLLQHWAESFLQVSKTIHMILCYLLTTDCLITKVAIMSCSKPEVKVLNVRGDPVSVKDLTTKNRTVFALLRHLG